MTVQKDNQLVRARAGPVGWSCRWVYSHPTRSRRTNHANLRIWAGKVCYTWQGAVRGIEYGHCPRNAGSHHLSRTRAQTHPAQSSPGRWSAFSNALANDHCKSVTAGVHAVPVTVESFRPALANSFSRRLNTQVPILSNTAFKQYYEALTRISGRQACEKQQRSERTGKRVEG